MAKTPSPWDSTPLTTVTANAGEAGGTDTPATAAEPAGRGRMGAADAIGPAARIDRFLVVEKLGEGGMGTVYAAYDTLLDRKVALKVVRPDRQAALGKASPRDRLLREAQAMARLSHPNVVAVLDVGEIDDDVYVALEYVDGTTLKKWLREARRPWREVVAAFVQAGRGLSAAHQAGLVHRDFKPDNVLIRRDGRIQVADFGVVSMGAATHDSTPPGAEPPSQEQITYAGLRVGTPAYMAPEQHAGGAVDGRADQFGFCVSLWEGLFGERPFASKTVDGLAEAARRGEIRPPPAGSAVPRWVELAVRRGLAADPGDRWPSIDALLAELGRDPAAARRRAALGVLAVAALGGAITVAWIGWTRERPAATPCAGAERHLDGRWDAGRAAALRASFRATGLPYAESSAERVIVLLDDWSRRWVAMHAVACEATRVHGEQSEALLDARMRCLDRRLDEVGELAGLLIAADRDAVARAVEAASDLPSLDACADVDALTATVAPPSDPSTRDAIARVQHALARATAQERTGRYPAARELAAAAATDAVRIAYPPIQAEALLARGRLEAQAGDLAAAHASLAEAARLAATARDDGTSAAALVELVHVLAEQSRGAEALAMAIAARAAAARAGDRALDAELLGNIGEAHRIAGDLAAAEAELGRALEARRELLGADHVKVAQVLNLLGGVRARQGHGDQAQRDYQEALRITMAQYGDAHPATAVTRANLCFLDAEAGELARARACQEQVLATLEAALGADHPQVAWALNEVALTQQQEGDVAGARPRFERALAIWEKTSGPDHPDVAWPLVNLGAIALAEEDLDRAEALCGRAHRVVVAASGADHPDAELPGECLAAIAEARRARR
jgi:tetratricopeptide (TPR) repeat protein/tRNA A-37 threonylcarbamoyl transferase component Bud32